MMIAGLLLIVGIIIDMVNAGTSTQQQNVKLELIRHQPCMWRADVSRWQRKIHFEGGQKGSGSQLIADQWRPGCYSIRGRVTVYEEVRDALAIYLALSNSGDRVVPPEPCKDFNKETACGGIGSCLYCRPCESLQNGENIVGAELQLNGTKIGCQTLKPGQYSNVSLQFCLPDVNRLLQWQEISESALNSLLKGSSMDGSQPAKLNVFASVYVFEKNVHSLMITQRKLEDRIRQNRGLGIDDRLDSNTYWSLPFNQLIRQQREFIGCHKLYGTIQFVDN